MSGPTEHFVEVDLPPSEQDVGYPGPGSDAHCIVDARCRTWNQSSSNCNYPPLLRLRRRRVAGDDSNPNTIPDAGVGAWVLDQFVLMATL